MSLHRERIINVSIDKYMIPSKEKDKISYILITGNDSTQEPYKSKNDSIIDGHNNNLKKRLHHVKISKTTLVVLMIRHVKTC